MKRLLLIVISLLQANSLLLSSQGFARNDNDDDEGYTESYVSDSASNYKNQFGKAKSVRSNASHATTAKSAFQRKARTSLNDDDEVGTEAILDELKDYVLRGYSNKFFNTFRSLNLDKKAKRELIEKIDSDLLPGVPNSQGFSVEPFAYSAKSVLNFAVKEKNLDLVRLLVELFDNQNARKEFINKTDLEQFKGDQAKIHEFIQRTSHYAYYLRNRGFIGGTALLTAIEYDCFDIADYLYRNGASVNNSSAGILGGINFDKNFAYYPSSEQIYHETEFSLAVQKEGKFLDLAKKMIDDKKVDKQIPINEEAVFKYYSLISILKYQQMYEVHKGFTLQEIKEVEDLVARILKRINSRLILPSNSAVGKNYNQIDPKVSDLWLKGKGNGNGISIDWQNILFMTFHSYQLSNGLYSFEISGGNYTEARRLLLTFNLILISEDQKHPNYHGTTYKNRITKDLLKIEFENKPTITFSDHVNKTIDLINRSQYQYPRYKDERQPVEYIYDFLNDSRLVRRVNVPGTQDYIVITSNRTDVIRLYLKNTAPHRWLLTDAYIYLVAIFEETDLEDGDSIAFRDIANPQNTIEKQKYLAFGDLSLEDKKLLTDKVLLKDYQTNNDLSSDEEGHLEAESEDDQGQKTIEKYKRLYEKNGGFTIQDYRKFRQFLQVKRDYDKFWDIEFRKYRIKYESYFSKDNRYSFDLVGGSRCTSWKNLEKIGLVQIVKEIPEPNSSDSGKPVKYQLINRITGGTFERLCYPEGYTAVKSNTDFYDKELHLGNYTDEKKSTVSPAAKSTASSTISNTASPAAKSTVNTSVKSIAAPPVHNTASPAAKSTASPAAKSYHSHSAKNYPQQPHQQQPYANNYNNQYQQHHQRHQQVPPSHAMNYPQQSYQQQPYANNYNNQYQQHHQYQQVPHSHTVNYSQQQSYQQQSSQYYQQQPYGAHYNN